MAAALTGLGDLGALGTWYIGWETSAGLGLHGFRELTGINSRCRAPSLPPSLERQPRHNGPGPPGPTARGNPAPHGGTARSGHEGPWARAGLGEER